MIGTNRTFSARLLRWYDAHRRQLPWRIVDASTHRPEPYRVLVSEAMLQQTQVATVVPYFLRFIERFPSVEELAHADEQDVLRMWQGLGYYSRARNLQAAARKIVSEHGGEVPQTVEALHHLPGVGRYTAGAVASIAFDRRAPIVDGNVARVICRIDRIESNPRERETLNRIWKRAEQFLPTARCGDFNSALMELGATVCTPRTPKCLTCPVRAHCEALAAGIQERIPPPKQRRPTPLHRRDVLCMRNGDKWLIEQRPPCGRWAGMWQFLTMPSSPSNRVNGNRQLGVVTHALTHRRYRFRVITCPKLPPGLQERSQGKRVWVTLQELDRYPLPRPHLKVAQMLRDALNR